MTTGKKGFLGSKTNVSAAQNTTTLQGGNAYTLTIEEKLGHVFTMGLMQGNFYTSQEDVIKATRDLFVQALIDMPYIATQYAVYAAEELGMKLAPTIWLVYVSTLEDKTLFKASFDRIIGNPKMLHDFMEIARKGGIRKGFKGDMNGMGQSVKKTVNNWLYQYLNEYNATRYTGKLEDVVRLSRPKDKVVNRVNSRNGETDQVDVGNILQYIFKPKDAPRRLTFARASDLQTVIDSLNAGVINDEVRNLIKKQKFQLEELKHTFGNLSTDQKKEVFLYFVPGLRYNALTSNLVAIERAFATRTQKENRLDPSGSGKSYQTTVVMTTDIPSELRTIVANKLANFDDFKASKMLPFGLLTAHEMTITQEWRDALNKTLKRSGEVAFSDIPSGTKVMVGADTSGSMGTQITTSLRAVDVASYFASCVGMSIPNSATFATASTSKEVRMIQGGNLVDNAVRIAKTDVGMGTNFESLLTHYNGENVVVLITDGQDSSNMERKWASLNRPANAKLIIWHVAGHNYFNKISNRSDVLYLKGYSDTLLRTITNIIAGRAGQASIVRSVKL